MDNKIVNMLADVLKNDNMLSVLSLIATKNPEVFSEACEKFNTVAVVNDVAEYEADLLCEIIIARTDAIYRPAPSVISSIIRDIKSGKDSSAERKICSISRNIVEEDASNVIHFFKKDVDACLLREIVMQKTGAIFKIADMEPVVKLAAIGETHSAVKKLQDLAPTFITFDLSQDLILKFLEQRKA